jgi:acid phosphatase type 7
MKMVRKGFRAALLMAAAVSVLAFAAGVKAQDRDADHDHNSHFDDNAWPHALTHKSPVLVVVGDVACQPDADFETGEAPNETCDTPKAPYTSTTSNPPGSSVGYSLWLSQEATANQIESIKPDAVALLGDLQYQVGQYQDFEKSYDLTFGAFKKITRPAPGNHEFYDEHKQIGVAGYGYFSYFNGFQIDGSGNPLEVTLGDPCPSSQTGCSYPASTAAVGQPIPRSDGQAGHFDQTGGVQTAVYTNGPSTGKPAPVGVGDGWYSYNLGAWHLISLNIECETQPGACSFSNGTWLAAETEWLRKDLEENHSACTLAYWHQPTYSGADSLTEEGITAGTWWQMLYDAGADLVLNGHDHLYARYAPIRPYFDASDTSVTGVTGTWLGTSDPRRGIREFIVGSGGETLDTVVTAPTSATDWDGKFNQQFLQNSTGNYWGVMALTLDPNGYQWDYESALKFPGAPAGTPATFSDKGSAACHGGPWGDNR